jgi:urease accessory protein UreF
MALGGAVDIVLGVSMAPTSVRMLLVEGENADGVTVEDNQFDIATDDDAATLSAADQVISAILGTREGATEAGHALTSTGVTWTDPVDAAGLHEALATRKIENVMLVSAFMAAAALAQTVGNTVGDHHTALLFLERDTATLSPGISSL